MNRDLPTSRAYRRNPERPHAIKPVYPEDWEEVRRAKLRQNRRRSGHTDARGYPVGACEQCGIIEGALYYNAETQRSVRAVLQVVHLHHNPENIAPDELGVWCATCHRAHDKQHQGSGSALTLACEDRLPLSRLHERLEDLRDAARLEGLIGMGPGGVDLALAALLADQGAQTPEQLTAALMAEYRLNESVADARACVCSGLHRLRERHLPVIAGDTWSEGPSLLHYARGVCTLRLPRLGNPNIELAGRGLWSHMSRRHAS